MPEVHVVGRILRARGFAPHARLSCHWRVVLDDSSRHWRVLEGAGGGETVVSERVLSEASVLWNHGFNFNLACGSIKGWPRLLFEVSNTDEWERVDVAGYALCFLPCSAGEAKLTVPAFRPQGSSIEELMAKFIGGFPRYERPEALASPESRFNHRTVSVGLIEVEIGVVLRGFGPNVSLGLCGATAKKDAEARADNALAAAAESAAESAAASQLHVDPVLEGGQE